MNVTENAALTPPMLRQLRALVPQGDLTLADLLQHISELARALRRLAAARGDYVSTRFAHRQAALRIEDMSLPASGMSFWHEDTHQWVIKLNEEESNLVRRFTLIHELAHIIWHGYEERLLPGMSDDCRQRALEVVADMLASETLMPRDRVIRRYCAGVTHPADLAKLFKVAPNAMRGRLAELGLTEGAMPSTVTACTHLIREPQPRN